jgi:hypothetical protein
VDDGDVLDRGLPGELPARPQPPDCRSAGVDQGDAIVAWGYRRLLAGTITPSIHTSHPAMAPASMMAPKTR